MACDILNDRINLESYSAFRHEVEHEYDTKQYYEKYCNEVFTEECGCSTKPYRVGKIYTFPLSIDIDDWLAKNYE